MYNTKAIDAYWKFAIDGILGGLYRLNVQNWEEIDTIPAHVNR